jgi:hypothetical protein
MTPSRQNMAAIIRRLRIAQRSEVGFQHRLILSRDERILAAHAPSIALPVQPEDQGRIDEKYPLRGYGSIDARAGVNWNQQEE